MNENALSFSSDVDHTTNTGSGYLMLADMSKRVVNDFARFRGPQVTSAQCMTFYYHVFGHGGTMNIYQGNGGDIGAPLWTRSGSQGDVWRFGRMSIDRANNYVVFEGK